MQLHDMRKSSSSRSGRTFGPCPSIPRSDLGPTTCFPPWRSSCSAPVQSSPAWFPRTPSFAGSSSSGLARVQSSPAWFPRTPSSAGCLSKQGSRVSPYKKTAEDPPYKEAESPVCYFQSISAMTVYSNKSHEELRHEDYQIQNKGLSGKGSRVSPYKKTADDPCNEAGSSASKKKEAGSPNWYFQSISAMPVYSSKSHEELRYEDYQIQHKGGVMTNPAPLVPLPSPSSIEHPSTRLQSSTLGPKCSPIPFWLPSARLQSPISSAHLQSSKQGPYASTSSPSFSFPVIPMEFQNPPFFPIFSDQQHTKFKMNTSPYGPSSLTMPCTAHGGTLLGSETHTASATPPSTKTKAAFSPNSLISTSPPTSRQENVFSNTAAAYATSSEATSTQSSTFGQKVSTTFTESGSSSDAHSEPSLSPHAHCTSAKVDYPNNAIELLLPTSISLVKIRFSSQAHSNHVARALEIPISLSIYPGENEELIIQSIEQPRQRAANPNDLLENCSAHMSTLSFGGDGRAAPSVN